MNRSLLLALAVTLFVASPLVLSVEPARASCAPGTPDFDLAFEGVAVEGPEDPSTGQLLSPARFNVEEWIEGEGPSRVEVVTATQVEGDLIRSDSVGITPKAGERWLIQGTRGREGVIDTDICAGSERLRADPTPATATTTEPRAGLEHDIAMPGDDRALSLGVAAAGAVAIAVVLSRRWD